MGKAFRRLLHIAKLNHFHVLCSDLSSTHDARIESLLGCYSVSNSKHVLIPEDVCEEVVETSVVEEGGLRRR